jgi:hypothetical protein
MADPPKAVPKFTSFRPKPAPIPESQDSLQAKNKTHRQQEEKEHRSKHDRHKSVSKESRRSATTARNVEIARVQLPVFEDENTTLFKVDREGDIQNLTYRSLHKYNVPPYRRVGYGNVLGLDTKIKIDRDNSNEKQIVLQERGLKNLSIRRLLMKPNDKDVRRMRLIHANQDDQLLHPEEDFVFLGTSRKRKRGSQSHSEDEMNYRSIEGKAKSSSEPIDSDLEYATVSAADQEVEELVFKEAQSIYLGIPKSACCF